MLEKKTIIDNSSKEKNTNLKKKRNIFIYTFTIQIFVCATIVFGIFIIKSVSLSQYNKISRKIAIALKDSSLQNFIDAIHLKINSFFKNSKQNLKKEQEKEELEKEINYEGKKQEDSANSKTIPTNSEEYFFSICSKDDDDVLFFNFEQPLKGCVSSKYGKRENPLLKGREDFHYGIDISAKNGTPIIAISDGVVKIASSSKKSGNFVSIQHGDIYESLYAHCSKVLVNKGMSVKKGEKIALCGQSGEVTGPHLHLGIKKNGCWIDPIQVFPNLV